MVDVRDGYEAYYQERLWQLLPAVYRTEDSPDPDALTARGPLRELVDRIGVQAAIVRRSIDRLWEDQSIETCDDWVIAYIGDLLATNLVAGLDARGQRLDVAKTIYYRRRKGTVAILEEIPANITGWDARVVEFFRHLGRTRHSLDPPIGLPAETNDPFGNRRLQAAEGLIGPLTQTAIGGYADLRNVYGASKAHTAFDEFFHTADFRRGRGQVGWHNIPRLGVFLWRLRSFAVTDGTPVPVAGAAGEYVFDPTGRRVPLFARPLVATDRYGDAWVSPEEWQLAAPISKQLYDAIAAIHSPLPGVRPYPNPDASLYPESVEVSTLNGSFFDALPLDAVTICPETGRFIFAGGAAGAELRVKYHYGFSSKIGAGPYERRVLHAHPMPIPAPEQPVSGGGNALVAPLAALGPIGTLTLTDSLTYTQVSDVGSDVAPIATVTLRAANEQRPVIRVPTDGADWTFHGQSATDLTLDGLFLSGRDLVLRGDFDTVRLTCCTLDPGSSGAEDTPPRVFARSADGRNLRPSTLWVEGGTVRRLEIERCIVGPVRTHLDGVIEALTITDSIVQAIQTADAGANFVTGDVKDPARLATRLRERRDPVAQYLVGEFRPRVRRLLAAYTDGTVPPAPTLIQGIVDGLNVALGRPLFDPLRFARVHLRPATRQLAAANPAGADLVRLNRLLIEDAFPTELADLALATRDGAVALTRSTLLGPVHIHRLEASECILDDVVTVEDVQHGCVRFPAWSDGSILPRQYESVAVVPAAPLFTSRDFGAPGYAQLLSDADRRIRAGQPGASVNAGAQNGSEMGAFSRENNPIKARSLAIKYEEFMPLGLVPVVIYVA